MIDVDKVEPAETYKELKTQFYALKKLLKLKGEEADFYRKKLESVDILRLTELERSLESEKDMNAQLTKELEDRINHMYRGVGSSADPSQKHVVPVTQARYDYLSSKGEIHPDIIYDIIDE